MNTITLNGVRSDTIQGLLIQSLPPISKPPMRVNVEEIDGRNGDIITDLGYQAYDKTITIGLRGEFDINDVISFFNSEGTVVFSNEPDKYYRYKIYQQIDFERLIRFRVATVTMHVQPFKYPLNETPISVSSLIWEGTDYDQTPYIFRAVSDSSVEAGNREVIEQITGGTVAWNQLVTNGDFSNGTNGWSRGSSKSPISASNGEVAVTIGNAWNNDVKQAIKTQENHVYFLRFSAKCDEPLSGNNDILLATTPTSSLVPSSTMTLTESYQTSETISKSNSSQTGIRLTLKKDGTAYIGQKYYVKSINIIDLTQMFGSTIADYIYSLEQSAAGAGVSLFKSLFPKDYYAYNAGELMSVKTSARETTGKNLLAPYTRPDSSAGGVTWSYQGGSFTARGTATGSSYASLIGHNWQSVEGSIFGNLLGKQITISGGKDGIYMNLAFRRNSSDSVYQTNLVTNGTITVPTDGSYQVYFKARVTSGWSGEVTIHPQVELGSTATSYEPYQKHTYPLSNIELRGIPKLVNNKIQYDGDIYKADGSVTRRYGIRAYQSGDATGETMITDGTNTVYALSTPTTETTTPYTETQICSPYGTEEFIDSRDVQIPVGHKTRYEQIEPINIEITNSGNVPSMPTYRIEGSGSVDVNIDGLHAVTVDMSNINAITINSEEMNAYNDTGGFANRSVTGSYENLALPVGQNTLEIDGDGVIDLLVTNYERWL